MASTESRIAMSGKQHLGDGCYVEYDGYALVLSTENGLTVTNRIVLESSVYLKLTDFVTRLQAGESQEVSR